VVAVAAVPLADADGNIVGAFCAMDRRPHRWPAEEVAILEQLAGIAMRMLEMERVIGDRESDPLPSTAAPVLLASQASAPVPAAATSSPGAAAVDDIEITVDDDIVDLVPGYVTAQRQHVENLLTLLDKIDFTTIRQLGHRMKGSGAGYGLPGVSRIGRDLETAAEGGDGPSVRRLLIELQQYLSRLNIRSANGRMVMPR